MGDLHLLDGAKLDAVIVETVIKGRSKIPVARPVSHLPSDTRVQLDSSLCKEFPVGTQFRVSATFKRLSYPNGNGVVHHHHFKVTHANAIVDSIPDANLRAILGQVKADSSLRRVRNCPSAYKCAKTWDELEELEAPDVRHCRDCSKNVFLCETIAEICSATKEGKCVAVMAAAVTDHSNEHVEDFVGYVEDGID